jgi:aspartate/methionine/tyrosine aminotransferase
MMALPGLKIGWIAVTGNADLVNQSLHALDVISDTFLPVNEAAQFALPLLFRHGNRLLNKFHAEIHKQRDYAVSLFKNIHGIGLTPPEGGFYLTLKLFEGQDEEQVALRLLKDGFLVHPGYFYDLDGSHIVISFIDLKRAGSGFVRAIRGQTRKDSKQEPR